ncbi:DeoR family transcriptional regulator [Bacillaceae bacterium SAOS 7]|nr:DeoR family transcriptional regulator [Bacillaceae bacterium SAOS 7]
MFAKERYAVILDILQEHQSVRVSELTERFQVSIETVRRDLEALEKEGHLKRVHGGAVLEDVHSIQETNFTTREQKYIEEKMEIAKVASRFVIEGQSLALDVSTTNTEFAKVLVEKFERLTILTNSLQIANVLAKKPYFTIIMPGGVLRNEELCTTGEIAESAVSQFNIDTFFMSMSGISLTTGLTDYGIGEVEIKKRMLQSAQKAIVLADSSKFGVAALLKVCDFQDVSKVITDSKIDSAIIEKYKTHGIKVINQ